MLVELLAALRKMDKALVSLNKVAAECELWNSVSRFGPDRTRTLIGFCVTVRPKLEELVRRLRNVEKRAREELENMGG